MSFLIELCCCAFFLIRLSDDTHDTLLQTNGHEYTSDVIITAVPIELESVRARVRIRESFPGQFLVEWPAHTCVVRMRAQPRPISGAGRKIKKNQTAARSD